MCVRASGRPALFLKTSVNSFVTGTTAALVFHSIHGSVGFDVQRKATFPEWVLHPRSPWLIAQCPLSCGLSSFYSPFSLVRSSAGSTRRGRVIASQKLLQFQYLFLCSVLFSVALLTRLTNAYGSLTPGLESTARVPLQSQKNFSIFIIDFTKVSKTHVKNSSMKNFGWNDES